MNLVLVTSVLRPVNDTTIFTTAQRIGQTIRTIKSIREKVDNPYIVMIEGGVITDDEKELFNTLANYLFTTDVSNVSKSQGEGWLIYRYLTSEHYKSLVSNESEPLCSSNMKYCVNTITKISGRYYPNERFNNLSEQTDKTIILSTDNSWSGHPVYNTTYYRIPYDKVRQFTTNLHTYVSSDIDTIDIEHAFHMFNIIDKNNVYSSDKEEIVLGISGMITRTGEVITI
jgi:hypothetical protein